MDEVATKVELNEWFSTYGLITAERILGKYQITLAQTDLLTALKIPSSYYHRILQVPLKNVLNGIVLQQAHDYHVYAQKLFVDYLLSGESAKDEAAQGALTREGMEDERKKLVELGEEFSKKKLEHDALIAKSQLVLIKSAKEWNSALDSAVKLFHASLLKAGAKVKKSEIRHAINQAMIHCDQSHSAADKISIIDKITAVLDQFLTEEIKTNLQKHIEDLIIISSDLDNQFAPFLQECREMSEQANSYRTQFYAGILRVMELIRLLPEYRIDPVQDHVNRETLQFDKQIGEC